MSVLIKGGRIVTQQARLSHTREEDTDEADLKLALTALERLAAGELSRRG
jgi:hypothetical protein